MDIARQSIIKGVKEQEQNILELLSNLESFTLVKHALNITSREIWTPTFKITPSSQTSFVRQYIPIFVKCIQQYGYIIIRKTKNGLDVADTALTTLLLAKLATTNQPTPVGKLSDCKQFYVWDSTIPKEDLCKCTFYVFILNRPKFDQYGKMLHPTSAGYDAMSLVLEYEKRKQYDLKRDENNSRHVFYTQIKSVDDTTIQSLEEDVIDDDENEFLPLKDKEHDENTRSAIFEEMDAVEFPFKNCDVSQTSYQTRPQDWSSQMSTIAQTVAQNYRMPKSFAAGMEPTNIGGSAKKQENELLQWSRFITDLRIICIDLFRMYDIEVDIVTHVQPEQLPHILSVVNPSFGKQMFSDTYGISVDEIDDARYINYVESIIPSMELRKREKKRTHKDDVQEFEREKKVAHKESSDNLDSIIGESNKRNGPEESMG